MHFEHRHAGMNREYGQETVNREMDKVVWYTKKEAKRAVNTG